MATDADTTCRTLSGTTETGTLGSPGDTSPSETGRRLNSTDVGTEPELAPQPEVSDVQAVEDRDYDAAGDAEARLNSHESVSVTQPTPHMRAAMAVGSLIVVGLGFLLGWLGFRVYQSHEADVQRELFVQVAQQGALNLTTVDWEHVDRDVQRILDSATGSFHDDFSKRSQPFIDVVKQAHSKSVGRIVEAGLESESGNEAQVLVVARVEVSNAGAAEQEPRAWRMRISVQKVDGEAKVSNVAFVP